MNAHYPLTAQMHLPMQGFACTHPRTHTHTHKQNALPVLITGYLNCLKGIVPVRGWISNQRLGKKSDRDRKQKEE